jgi:hypothetical protein
VSKKSDKIWKIIRQKWSKSEFLGHPMTVKTAGKVSVYIPRLTKHILFSEHCSKTHSRASKFEKKGRSLG